MQQPIRNPAEGNSLLQRIMSCLLPSLQRSSSHDAARMSLIHSVSLGKDCQLFLVAWGQERYLVGRGKASVDSIVRIGAQGAPAGEISAAAAGQPWHQVNPAEYASA